MNGGAVGAAEAAVSRIDELGARVHAGLRDGRLAAGDAVALACEALDWGHSGRAVREVVERDPAQVGAAEMAELARRVLAETGFDPGFARAPERLAVLRRALRIAARDLPTAGITGAPRLVLLEEFTPVSAGVELADGRLLTGGAGLPAAAGDGLAGALVAVAGLVQDDLLRRTWRVWPVCPGHGLGLHAREDRGSAVWGCAGGGGHAVALVGALGRR
ncbi:hypothetical protein SAMN05216267_101065 [Actinacidiphila rubida]|uniref:Uncharacterized protein n=1 Tax=Actinacidiphila rubida TaxID=310780 RepID=A0A1H8JF63_9ACTN|nr:hypothetical protein [Actinacidiphila rubida]SEN78946.1 hypothetical protein SAMN05216267_101065 [Actinacidiphila rubida]